MEPPGRIQAGAGLSAGRWRRQGSFKSDRRCLTAQSLELLTGMDSEDLSRDYAVRRPTYEHLQKEVEFALAEALLNAGIKPHSVAGRVKTLESLEDKVGRKGYADPLIEAEDLVGVRIVTLFLSDLPRVRDVIRQTFEVKTEEDRVEGADVSTFGYMSVHYVGTIREEHRGPRYDSIKGIVFEIQVRTIVMDAWANISHYLAYKGEASVPRSLKRDFHALSGLFYVADQHFELFFKETIEAEQDAIAQVSSPRDEPVEINRDTFKAYLRQRYPDRLAAGAHFTSELVEEVTAAGYTTLEEFDSAIEDADFASYERANPPGEGEHFMDVGAARLSLAIVDSSYREDKYGDDPTFSPHYRPSD